MANRPRGSTKQGKSKEVLKLRQFWDNIDYLKRQNDMTNKQIAKIMGISPGTIQNRQKDVVSTNGKEMVRAAEFFKIPLEYLFRPLVPDVSLKPYFFDEDEETS